MFIPVYSPIIITDEQAEPLLFAGGIISFDEISDAVLTNEGVVYAS